VLLEPRPAAPLGALLLAHGAGGAPEHPRMRARAEALARAGFAVARFPFPYRARGARMPDRMPTLVGAYRAVAAALRAGPCADLPLLLGGHSLGGRVASVLAAEGEPCAGLVLLSYPLHPARRPERPRVEHLAALEVPVFCAQGTRDPFCECALLEAALARLARPWTIEWIEGADHDLALPRRALRQGAEDGLERAARAAAAWARGLARGAV
jgi:predicted alpha/beta-hydrolase family hydrolase